MDNAKLIRLLNSDDLSVNRLGVEYLRAIAKETGKNVLDMFYDLAIEGMHANTKPYITGVSAYELSFTYKMFHTRFTFAIFDMLHAETVDLLCHPFCWQKEVKWFSDVRYKSFRDYGWAYQQGITLRKYIEKALHQTFNQHYLGKVR